VCFFHLHFRNLIYVLCLRKFNLSLHTKSIHNNLVEKNLIGFPWNNIWQICFLEFFLSIPKSKSLLQITNAQIHPWSFFYWNEALLLSMKAFC
jgi:hypothetical protein